MIDTSRATPELFAALAKAQAEVENASKNAQNPHFRNNYADLAEVLNTVRPVFAANGVSVSQFPSFDGKLASVSTVLAHASGGFLTGIASCVPAKTDAQGIGAATTYLRRYSLAAACGVAQEDDDGNAAAHNKKPAKGDDSLKTTPAGGIFDRMDEESQKFILDRAVQVTARYDAGDIDGAWAYIHEQQFDGDEKIALWSRLDSKVRTALKKAEAAAKEEKK